MSSISELYNHIMSLVGFSYYTKTETDDKYADKSDIPTKTSDLTNDSGFLTSHATVDSELSSSSTNAVQNKIISNALDDKSTVSFTRSLSSGTKIGSITIDGTSTDLYCETDTNTTYSAGTGLSLSNATFNHSNSVTALTTSSLMKFKFDAQGHITGTDSVSASDLPDITVSKITDFPTDVSEFTNDAGYLTSHQSISVTDNNSSDGSSLASITAGGSSVGTVYHPKVNSATLTGVPTSNVSPAFGGSFTVSQPVVNTDGHVTSLTSRTITIPSTTASTSAYGITKLSSSVSSTSTTLAATASAVRTAYNLANGKLGTATYSNGSLTVS